MTKATIHFFDRPTVILLLALAILSVVMVMLGADFEGLDLKFYYSGEEALKILNALSLEQRQRYLVIEFLDFGYITLYTAFLAWNLRKLAPSGWKFVSPIPGLFDLVENIGIITWLLAPQESSLVRFLSFFTMAKWFFGALLVIWLLERSLCQGRLERKSEMLNDKSI